MKSTFLIAIAVALTACLLASDVAAKGNKKSAGRRNQARKQQANKQREDRIEQHSIQKQDEINDRLSAYRQAASQEFAAGTNRAQIAAAHIQFLDSNLDNLRVVLQSFEEDIIAAHADDSTIKLAVIDEERAELAYTEAQRIVVESAAYKATYAAAKASPNKATELLRVRTKFLDDDVAASNAKEDLSAARKRLEVARQQVLRTNEDWLRTIEEIRSVKNQIAYAKQSIAHGQLSRAAAVNAYESAVDAAVRAKISIALRAAAMRIK